MFDNTWWWTFGTVPEVDSNQLLSIVQQKQQNNDNNNKDINNNSPQILDVRTESEFNAGHIDKAINCSFLPSVWTFQTRLEQIPLDKTKPIYCICLSAHRSIAAVKLLRQLGFEAYQLQGGMKEWRRLELPEIKEE
ncbi:hypothetical protein ABK040_007656 [Willaertia magna]